MAGKIRLDTLHREMPEEGLREILLTLSQHVEGEPMSLTNRLSQM
jgi:hypothetical protein